MSTGAELAWLDATAQARLVADGVVSAVELAAAAHGRVVDVDPLVNAIVTRFDDVEARSAAGLATGGGLAGVPFLRKDLGVTVAGEPIFLGNAALREAGYRATWTHELARRFDALGLVTLGTTNTPEMGAQTTTQPLSTGATRNPWDPSLSASGSSGGAAAAVASGMVALAHANDYLGSTRLPAAWQGVVGIKASRGRVPVGHLTTSRMSSEGVLARSVRDIAAVLDGVSGYAPGELFQALEPRGAYRDDVARAVAGGMPPLRVGLLTCAPHGVEVQPHMVRAVEQAGALLEEAGHHVEFDHPPALFEERSAPARFGGGADHRRRIDVLSMLLGRPATEADVEPYLWAMGRRGGETADSYMAERAWEQAWSVRVTSWWEPPGVPTRASAGPEPAGYDLLVTPTVATGPQPLDELEPPPEDPASLFDRHVSRHVVLTAPWNVTGQPALAMPLRTHAHPGPPASVQLVGAPQRDDIVLAAAALVEQARPSVERPPRILRHDDRAATVSTP